MEEGYEMEINVKYLGVIRGICGKKEEKIELEDNSKLLDLFTILTDTYGSRFTNIVFDPKKCEMQEGFVTVINGISINQLKNMDTVLNDGDDIVLMPAISGG